MVTNGPITVDALRELTRDALTAAKTQAATYADMAVKMPRYEQLAGYHAGMRDTLQAIMNVVEA